MSDYFPQEVIELILHKLHPKSLLKCISVCKLWKSLITHPSFITHHHHHHHQDPSLFLHLHTIKPKPPNGIVRISYDDFSFLSSNDNQPHHRFALKFPLSHFFSSNKPPSIVDSCNGLLCFADHSPPSPAAANIAVWNPSLQKHVLLPKPNYTLSSSSSSSDSINNQVFFGFGFDSINNDFKILRFLTLEHTESPPNVEIFSLTSRSWRILPPSSSLPPSFSLSKHTWKPHQTFVNGVIHWVVTRRNKINGRIENFVLSFDVCKEKFGELTLPRCLKESPFQVSILGGGGGSLAVIHKNNSYFDQNFFSIWVMKEYGDSKSWTQLCEFDSVSGVQGTPSVLALRSNGEIVMKSSHDGIVLLEPMKGLVKKVGYKGYFNVCAGDYVESLFLLNEKMQKLELESECDSSESFTELSLQQRILSTVYSDEAY